MTIPQDVNAIKSMMESVQKTIDENSCAQVYYNQTNLLEDKIQTLNGWNEKLNNTEVEYGNLTSEILGILNSVDAENTFINEFKEYAASQINSCSSTNVGKIDNFCSIVGRYIQKYQGDQETAYTTAKNMETLLATAQQQMEELREALVKAGPLADSYYA